MDKKKILLIDDEQDFCTLFKKNIERVDGAFEVSVATSGQEGIKLAREIRPDLVLLDIMMPQMDGGDVASAIKNNIETKDTPIVFLTSLARPGEDGSEMKGYPVLSKTVTVGVLIDFIKKNVR